MRNLKTVIEVDFICRYSYVCMCMELLCRQVHGDHTLGNE